MHINLHLSDDSYKALAILAPLASKLLNVQSGHHTLNNILIESGYTDNRITQVLNVSVVVRDEHVHNNSINLKVEFSHIEDNVGKKGTCYVCVQHGDVVCEF